MMNNDEFKSKSSLQSVSNALRVLKLFNNTDTQLGISEISRRMKIGKSTAFRLVTTLLNEGFLDQDKESSKYYLGIELLARARRPTRSPIPLAHDLVCGHRSSLWG